MKHVIILYTCDKHKSKSSMSPLYVETDISNVIRIIYEQIVPREMEWMGTSGLTSADIMRMHMDKVMEHTIDLYDIVDEINKYLTYGHVRVYEMGRYV